MDSEKKSGMDGSGGKSLHANVSGNIQTKMTSETLRLGLELNEGEKPNNVHDSVIAGNVLANQATQKRKTASFQITSVSSVVCNDGGEESPDETEDNNSEILDVSKITSDIELETLSLSEEYSKSEDMCAPATVIPTSSQYGITAVVQQSESGGLRTSRLPQGITVNVTQGGIALAEPDGVVSSDSENLLNRFKIVKIASNKPFKKGRWVCFDFMDSPASSNVSGNRNTDTTQDVSIPLVQDSYQKNLAQTQPMANTLNQPQAQVTASLAQQQYTSQTSNVHQGTIVYSSQISSQGYHSSTSQSVTTTPGGAASTQVGLQQQMIENHQQGTPSMPSQVIDNQPQQHQVSGSVSQSQKNNTGTVNKSSPVSQAVPGGSVTTSQKQQLTSQQNDQIPQPSAHQQVIQQQIQSQNVSAANMVSQQQIPQAISQQPQISMPSQQQINQQQQQAQQPHIQTQAMQAQQSSLATSQIPSSVPSQNPMHVQQDHSPMSIASNANYQATSIQQQVSQSQPSIVPSLQQQPAPPPQQSLPMSQPAPVTSTQVTQASAPIPSTSIPGISNYSSIPGINNITNVITSQIEPNSASHQLSGEAVPAAPLADAGGQSSNEAVPATGEDQSQGTGDEDRPR